MVPHFYCLLRIKPLAFHTLQNCSLSAKWNAVWLMNYWLKPKDLYVNRRKHWKLWSGSLCACGLGMSNWLWWWWWKGLLWIPLGFDSSPWPGHQRVMRGSFTDPPGQPGQLNLAGLRLDPRFWSHSFLGGGSTGGKPCTHIGSGG